MFSKTPNRRLAVPGPPSFRRRSGWTPLNGLRKWRYRSMEEAHSPVMRFYHLGYLATPIHLTTAQSSTPKVRRQRAEQLLSSIKLPTQNLSRERSGLAGVIQRMVWQQCSELQYLRFFFLFFLVKIFFLDRSLRGIREMPLFSPVF